MSLTKVTARCRWCFSFEKFRSSRENSGPAVRFPIKDVRRTTRLACWIAREAGVLRALPPQRVGGSDAPNRCARLHERTYSCVCAQKAEARKMGALYANTDRYASTAYAAGNTRWRLASKLNWRRVVEYGDRSAPGKHFSGFRYLLNDSGLQAVRMHLLCCLSCSRRSWITNNQHSHYPLSGSKWELLQASYLQTTRSYLQITLFGCLY